MGYYWRLNDDQGYLKQSFTHAVAWLRAPAGAKYRTLEDCHSNAIEFGRAFHRGLFLFHLQTIEHILLVEERLKSLSAVHASEQRSTKRGWDTVRQIFRTFNDCIAWIIFKEPSFTINRICRHRSRGFLMDQNVESIIRVITEISEDGDTLAIWNDATRAIDLGDITAISLKNRSLTFYEVKEGPVNDEILEIVQNNDPTVIAESLEAFFIRRGKSGLAQFERFIKQQMNSEKLHALVSTDDIEDPFTKERRTAISPNKPLEHYDSGELTQVLQEVREREFAYTCVDGCLHILAINQERMRGVCPIDSLIQTELKNRVTTPKPGEADCREVLISLQDTLYSAISMPVMLRPLDASDIADICIGNVLLVFMFDMNAWGKLLRQCRLSWSSVKEGRREQSKPFLHRRMVIDSRIPTITSLCGNHAVQLGDRILPLLVCQGIRPLSMAQHYDSWVAKPKTGEN
jgi:hypothetical protein